MGHRLDERELRARAIGGVREQVEAFGSAHSDSVLIRRPGLLAAIVPSSPQRSLFYSDPATLSETSIQWRGAFAGDEPFGCLGTIAIGDDCLIIGVATPPEHRGRERLGFRDLGFLEMWELRR